jgi:hypothetical protein
VFTASVSSLASVAEGRDDCQSQTTRNCTARWGYWMTTLWGMFFCAAASASSLTAAQQANVDEAVFLIAGDTPMKTVQLSDECFIDGCKGSTAAKTSALDTEQRQHWLDMIKKEIAYRKENAEIVAELKAAMVIGINYFDSSMKQNGERKTAWNARLNASMNAYSLQISKVKAEIELAKSMNAVN